MALGTPKALIMGPTYADYANACLMHGVDHAFVVVIGQRRFVNILSATVFSLEMARISKGYPTDLSGWRLKQGKSTSCWKKNY